MFVLTASSTASVIPWWGTVALSLGAGIIGGLFSRSNDQSRWRRDRRADAYARFISAAQEFAEEAGDLFIELRDLKEGQLKDRDERLDALQKGVRPVRNSFYEISVFGSKSVYSDVDHIWVQIDEFAKLIARPGADYVKFWDSNARGLFEVIQLLAEKMRVELGMTEYVRGTIAFVRHPKREFRSWRFQRSYRKQWD